MLFDKWCQASKVDDLEKLGELLNEQKVTLIAQAAVLADEFVLTHKSVFSSMFQRETMTMKSGKKFRSPKSPHRINY